MLTLCDIMLTLSDTFLHTRKKICTRAKKCTHTKKYAHAKNIHTRKIWRAEKIGYQKN